jgi:hypothetical protein
VDVRGWILYPIPCLYLLFQRVERHLEVGHFQASRVDDRQRNPFFRDLSDVLCDRPALACLGEISLEDGVDKAS